LFEKFKTQLNDIKKDLQVQTKSSEKGLKEKKKDLNPAEKIKSKLESAENSNSRGGNKSKDNKKSTAAKVGGVRKKK
jgi:hypothetical protein